MHKVNLRPLSVNEAYKSRKFRTPAHKQYSKVLGILIKRLKLPKLKPKQKFYVWYRFYTPANRDIDNNIKAFQDVLCTVLDTDDRYIYSAFVEKIVVKRGQECIEFAIFPTRDELIDAVVKTYE